MTTILFNAMQHVMTEANFPAGLGVTLHCSLLGAWNSGQYHLSDVRLLSIDLRLTFCSKLRRGKLHYRTHGRWPFKAYRCEALTHSL